MTIKPNIALIDKICLKNFTILHIDNFEKLQRLGIIFKYENASKYLYTNNGSIAFNYLNVPKSKLFDKFDIGIWQNSIHVSHLHLSVGDAELNNLNCLTIEEYKSKIRYIKLYLAAQYGIYVDFSCLIVDSIEINKTFILENPFETYETIFTFIVNNFPPKLRFNKKNDYAKRTPQGNVLQSINLSSGKKGLKFTLYNKSAQLREEKKIIIDDHITRMELKIPSSKRIKDWLGSEYLFNINDEAINKFFNKFVNKNIIEPWEADKLTRYKMALKTAKKMYATGSRTFVRNFIIEINNIILAKKAIKNCKNRMVLDINDIYEIIKKLPNEGTAKKHMRQSFRLCASKIAPYLLIDEYSKYNELITNVKGV